MRVEGVALLVGGDNVDTDVMYPGAYLNVEDPDEMAQYLFEGFDPTLRGRLVEHSRTRAIAIEAVVRQPPDAAMPYDLVQAELLDPLSQIAARS